MERLSFSEANLYSGLEASIHMARYAFARHLCAGKVVLDMACGEGYGSRMLSQWGAQRVIGVDISADAIGQAQRLFATEQIEFHRDAAETIGTSFAPGSFDLIVSLETIEHVPRPAALLEAFQRLLRPNGSIVISCPNDWWYYPGESERNPFHLRKYTLDEFRAESERVLGPARAWYFGAPMAGFCNTRLDRVVEATPAASQAVMLGAGLADNVMTLPAEPLAGPAARNASYFVGIWSSAPAPPLPDVAGAALLPLSMDAFKDGFFSECAHTNHALRQEVATLQRRLAALEQTGVWTLDEGPMAHALMRAEQIRESLERPGSAQAAATDQQTSRLSLLNRVAHIEKSMLLAQVQRLKALHERHGESREHARIARQRFDNERAAMRAHHESLMTALRTTRETQHEERAARARQATLMATLQAERESELVAAREQQESLRVSLLAQQEAQLELSVTREQMDSLRMALLDQQQAQQEVLQALSDTRERMRRLDAHAQTLQLHANRYVRLRECVPEPVRRIALAMVRRARRLVAALR